MKRMKHRRKRKRMETGVLVLLIIFLAAFIRFYPTESEDRGNLKDNVTEAVKNARETLTASAAEVQQTQKIKTGNVPQIFFLCMFISCDCFFQRSAAYPWIIAQIIHAVYDCLLYTLRCSQWVTVC